MFIDRPESCPSNNGHGYLNMVFENAKRLYAHYKEINNDKAAKELLQKYPQLEEKPKEKPKEEPKKKAKE